MAKAPGTHTLRQLVRRVSTPVERPLHAEMFKLQEIGEAETAKVGPSRTNLAYVNYMIATASR